MFEKLSYWNKLVREGQCYNLQTRIRNANLCQNSSCRSHRLKKDINENSDDDFNQLVTRHSTLLKY